ncbi:hypothetical protein [Arcobacter arenosus]|uniref:Uncharacterized protein n=1 Tax=Arcobacter arenosus TaxID=2576037 RepID=A0A5R8Y5T1_9BACT|nr:hypothetical protein [Arcobacter arenosus]TLP41023.1 hypothetical protein FDK22_03115 [Arcobacter arenosus]
MILDLIKNIKYIKYIPYLLVAIALYFAVSFIVDTYIENKELKLNIATMKQNEKDIINAYEYSIKELEIKNKTEATNKEAKSNAEKSIVRLKELNERHKDETVTSNNFVDFSF